MEVYRLSNFNFPISTFRIPPALSPPKGRPSPSAIRHPPFAIHHFHFQLFTSTF